MTRADDSAVPDYRNLLSLEGLNYLVLGAGQGMGRQTSHALHQVGARVFCVDVDPDRAKDIAAEVDGIAWSGDCTRRDAVEELVREAELKMGRIDGFVDIIGMAHFEELLAINDEKWNWQFDIVLRHAYLASQIAGKRMKETGGGTMVFVASVSGLDSAPMHAAYGAAKAGLMSWVRSLAIELAPYKIRANAVAPGAILTPRMKVLMDAERIEKNNRRTPLGRMGVPADIASAALYFSTPLSAYVTGRTMVVDGGVDCKFPYAD